MISSFRLQDVHDENKRLSEALEEQSQQEAQLRKNCEELKSALSSKELEIAESEHQRNLLEQEVKSLEESSGKQKDMLADAQQRHEDQQVC